MSHVGKVRTAITTAIVSLTATLALVGTAAAARPPQPGVSQTLSVPRVQAISTPIPGIVLPSAMAMGFTLQHVYLFSNPHIAGWHKVSGWSHAVPDAQYLTSNVWVGNGALHIYGQDNSGSNVCLCGTSRQGAVQGTYGLYVYRAKISHAYNVADGKKDQPAFLLWPANNHWSEGEIDWPETNTTRTIAQGTLHWDGAYGMTVRKMYLDVTQWHIYAIEWTKYSVSLYVDGRLFTTFWAGERGAKIPNTRFRFGTQIDSNSGWSMTTIDWVRAYRWNS